jgi:hypothetical protein
MTPMDLFGLPSDSQQVQALFQHFNTLRRPELADRYTYHDWVLVRRAGVELGFAEENYHHGQLPQLWGKGALLLTQVYFYAGFDDVAQYSGSLPFGMHWSDERQQVRERLGNLAHTLHSSKFSDTWDAPGYRITVHYSESAPQRPDKVICRQLRNVQLAPKPARTAPSLSWMYAQWGGNVSTSEWRLAWEGALDDEALEAGKEDGVIDLGASHGLALHVSPHRGELLLRAISLFGNGHEDSVQWPAELPWGLSFDDSPDALFQKITAKPIKRSEDVLMGYAVWHSQDMTLHVLYSLVDNRILRVKLLAPGTWKSATD